MSFVWIISHHTNGNLSLIICVCDTLDKAKKYTKTMIEDQNTNYGFNWRESKGGNDELMSFYAFNTMDIIVLHITKHVE